MCGIVLCFTPDAPTSVAQGQAMTATLRHRGPDDEGYLLWDGGTGLRLLGGADTPAAVRHAPTASQPQALAEDEPQRSAPLLLGHRRLAIVDLSPAGHQPMRRGAWAIAFNGEIYNHLELRAELQAGGCHFDGHSDTEVLLALLQHWGPDGLARCNGMWAFVALDLERRRLLIARDRFGVKPLYLWQGARGELLAASEIKALLAHPRVRSAPEMDAAVDFLRRGPSAWRAETGFEGITRFPPGHWAELALDAPAPLQPRAWWQPPALDESASAAPFDAARAERWQQEYREHLASAVAQRMRVDVRFGTALSGGLDSSSIALFVNDELRRRGGAERQEVFSSVYRSAATRAADESAFIERVAAQLDVRSNRIEPQVADLPAEHERMLWALDTPPANTLMSSWHTFALVARRGVVVTLDGQGADEQLAGYARYLRNHLVHAGVFGALREARRFAGGLQGFGGALAIGVGGALLRRLAGPAVLAGAVRRLGLGADPSPTVAQALAADFSTHLQNLLLYADKTAMAWSVESRMPFMDFRLVEFLARVPVSAKLHDGWTKWLARAALAGRLPPEVAWRRDKMGWAIPEPAWFGAGQPGTLGPWLAQQIGGSAFAAEVAGRAGIDPVQAPLALRLRLLNLAGWQRLFFEEPGRPGRPLGRGLGVGAPAREAADGGDAA